MSHGGREAKTPPASRSQPKGLTRLFSQRDYAMVIRRSSRRLWAAHTNPSVTIGLRS